MIIANERQPMIFTARPHSRWTNNHRWNCGYSIFYLYYYFAEFVSFRCQLRKSGWLAINRCFLEKCHKVHKLSTTDALCSSRQRSFLYITV